MFLRNTTDVPYYNKSFKIAMREFELPIFLIYMVARKKIEHKIIQNKKRRIKTWKYVTLENADVVLELSARL